MKWRRKQSSPTLRYAAQTDIGLVRTENQDSYGVFENGSTGVRELLFIVADGMGGHERGREASVVAVEAVRETYFATSEQSPLVRLRESFEEANRRVRECAVSDNEEVRMGTTCTVVALGPEVNCIGHIGDSRAYRIDDASIEQLTLDHTVAEELHREGVLTTHEASEHPSRNMLMRALGIEDDCNPDIFKIDPLRVNERLLLCSDGLARVETDEIASLVRDLEPDTACNDLIDLANRRGGHDNVTVILVTAS